MKVPQKTVVLPNLQTFGVCESQMQSPVNRKMEVHLKVEDGPQGLALVLGQSSLRVC